MLFEFGFGGALLGGAINLVTPTGRTAPADLVPEPSRRARFLWLFLSGFGASVLVIHPAGILGLMLVAQMDLSKAIATDLVFWPGDVVKNLVAAAIAIFVTVQKINEREKADRDRRAAQVEKDKADAARKAAEEAQRQLELEVEGFRTRLADLGKQMTVWKGFWIPQS